MRRLVLDSGVWRYRAGSYYDRDNFRQVPTLELLTPAGRHVDVCEADVIALGAEIPGHWQRAITPGAIRRYIEERLETL